MLFRYALRPGDGDAREAPVFRFALFVSLISQGMANCLSGAFRLCPSPSLEEIGVPLVVVAMTTAGTLATGGKFAFHGMDWTYCSTFTRGGILGGLGAQQCKGRTKISFAFVKCSGM